MFNGREVLEDSLYRFLKMSFSTLRPVDSFVDNWHISLLCEALEACERREVKRLIINIAPRNLKSIITSVAFPAWLLARNQSSQIIVSSYSQALSNKHSIDTKKIINSDWYKNNFDNVKITKEQNTKTKFLTTQGGFRLATSIGGTLTGEGGDFLIIDDPHNPNDLLSDIKMKKVHRWFATTLLSRLNSENGVIIVVMQRLHCNDLCDYILKNNKEDWELINLPIINENEKDVIFRGKFFHHWKANEPLNKKHLSKLRIEKIQQEIGSLNFSAQYLQHPVDIENGLIKQDWLKFYNHQDLPRINSLSRYLSIDCAQGVNPSNDFTAIISVAFDGNYFVLDILKRKITYPELRKTVIDYLSENKIDAILIEDKSNGSSLIQELKKMNYNIIAIKPTVGKVDRLNKALIEIESGKVFLPEFNTKWKEDFIKELLSFPNTKHDDQVDALTQIMNWKREYSVNRNLRIRMI